MACLSHYGVHHATKPYLIPMNRESNPFDLHFNIINISALRCSVLAVQGTCTTAASCCYGHLNASNSRFNIPSPANTEHLATIRRSLQHFYVTDAAQILTISSSRWQAARTHTCPLRELRFSWPSPCVTPVLPHAQDDSPLQGVLL